MLGFVRIPKEQSIKLLKWINIQSPKKDLFTSLAGGKAFTTLDMSQAYQQLLLDEPSKKLVVINTLKGLFQYNRLPFGITSAPGIIHRVMDSLLQGSVKADLAIYTHVLGVPGQ